MVSIWPGSDNGIPKLDFGAHGPTIAAVPLLLRTRSGFQPPPREELDETLRKHVEGSFDSKHAHERLRAIAKC